MPGTDVLYHTVDVTRTRIRTGVARRLTFNAEQNDAAGRQMAFHRPYMGVASVQSRRLSVCSDFNNNNNRSNADHMSCYSGFWSDHVGVVFPSGRRLRKKNGVKEDGEHHSLVSTHLYWF